MREGEPAAGRGGTYGTPREVAPAKAVLEEIARTAGHVDWLAVRVRALDPEALVWGRAQTRDVAASPTPGVNVTDAARVNAWLELYRAERKHLVDVCRVAEAMNAAGAEPAEDGVDDLKRRRDARRRA